MMESAEEEPAPTTAAEAPAIEATPKIREPPRNLGLLLLAGDLHNDTSEAASFPQFQVIAVHGLYGHRLGTWTTDAIGIESGTSWMTEQIYKEHKDAQVWTFGYDASTNRSGIATRSGIREKAFELLEALLVMRKQWESKPIPIGFVCHDLGGTIVKAALLIAARQYSKYRNILQWTRLLIFFGCPHQCKSTENMGDNLARLLFYEGVQPPEDAPKPSMEIASKKLGNYFVRAPQMGATDVLAELGRSVNEINGSFFASNMPALLSILNIYSSAIDPAVQVFREFTACMDISYEERISCAKPHTRLGHITQAEMDKNLRSRIDVKLKILYTGSPWDSGETSPEWLKTLRSLAAPLLPLLVPLGDQALLDWILVDETYTKWLDMNDGPAILHIHGTTRSSKAARYLFFILSSRQSSSPSTELPIYFSFNKYDDRRNSILGMLNTVLAQIFSHNIILADLASGYAEKMTLSRSWTEEELIVIFRVVLMTMTYRSIICILDGFDECDASGLAFLKDFCHFSTLTEHRWKIVFVSRTRPDIQSILAAWPTINVDENIEPENLKINLAYDIDVEVVGLLSRRPLYTNVQHHIRNLLVKLGEDDELRGLALRELTVARYSLSAQETSDQLIILSNSTSQDIFERIVARIPDHRQPWARRILSWTLFTFHPLTVWELAAAVSTEVDALNDDIARRPDDQVYQQFTADLQEFFAGMFVIRNCEVHFGHREVRDFLLATDSQEQSWYAVKETAHQEIASMCLAYLSLPWARFLIGLAHDLGPDGAWDSSVFSSRRDVSTYAIKYWSKHYRSIPETNRPTKSAIEFFKNRGTMYWWSEAYWWFSNPISRRDCSFESLLPIFAELGLHDLVKKELERMDKISESQQDRALALVEAARNALVETIRLLLQSGDYNQTTLLAALFAGSASGDETSIIELVTYTANNTEQFDWPGYLICRAAQLNQENLIKKLLEVGASPDAITMNALTALHIASRDGHAGVVRILLDAKADFKLVTDSGRVALHLAAYHGYTEIVKMLLDIGSDVNALDNEKDNALYLACLWGNYSTIKVLLEAGSDMGNDKNEVWTPLSIVVDGGYVKSTRLLLDKKANVEIEGPENKTPLRYAALRESLELCRLLVEYGADPNTPKGGQPILNHSSNDGNLEIVKLFVENGARVNEASINGWTPLHNAAINGHVDVLIFLLDHGADLHQKTGTGYNAFLLAVTSNFPEAVKILIDRGADVNAIDVDGWYPVHLAYNHAPTMRVLLEAGANPSIIGNNSSALYLASYYNKIDVVEALLPYKPDLEFTPPAGSGWTALSAAVTNEFPAIVRMLLEAGANVDHRSNLGEVPLQYAVANNNEEIARILMEFRPNLQIQDNIGNTALNSIARGETSIPLLRLLVNGGCDLEMRNNDREAPLHKAVRFEGPELVKFFISRKANLNAKGTKFGGPLHIACRWVNLEITELLVKGGADVDLVDEESSSATPLQSSFRGFAENGNYEDHERVVKCLLEEGKADVKVVGGLQGCAVNAACGWSSPDLVKLMLEKGAKVDVADGTGRMAIHFAASHTLEHFQPIQSAGANLEAMDKTKRTIVHWAAISGRPDMLERVLSLSRGEVDQPDIDGWTPLLWASRGTGTYLNRATDNMTEEVIKLLLERGADPCVIVKGLDCEWTPIKLARYHQVNESAIELLISKTKEKLEAKGKTFDESLHATKEGQRHAGSCDSCLSPMYGLAYECTVCLDFDFCFKCYGTRHLIHADHVFKVSETEYLEIPSDEKKSDESDDTDDDSDDSDGDDDTKKVEVNEEPEKEKEKESVVENGTGEEEEDSDTEDEG